MLFEYFFCEEMSNKKKNDFIDEIQKKEKIFERVRNNIFFREKTKKILSVLRIIDVLKVDRSIYILPHE